MATYRYGAVITLTKKPTSILRRSAPDPIRIGFSLPARSAAELAAWNSVLRVSAVGSSLSSLGSNLAAACDTAFAGYTYYQYDISYLSTEKP